MVSRTRDSVRSTLGCGTQHRPVPCDYVHNHFHKPIFSMSVTERSPPNKLLSHSH
uniref:Uncharacterized protein n=1 Tax=Arundo donax TaxID=35708 RepID=A0A0A8YKE5_ARUDO